MRILGPVVFATALLVAGGCSSDRTVLGPTSPAASVGDRSSAVAASSGGPVQASGNFQALVDFTSLTLTPRGRNCLLQVKGELVFTGTIQGSGTGQTSALVFAPCSQVATTPPGTFRDVFKSELTFNGTVNGQPASANVLYMGSVEPGGHIDGRLVFSNGVAGVLNVDARVAVGGSYSGSVVVTER